MMQTTSSWGQFYPSHYEPAFPESAMYVDGFDVHVDVALNDKAAIATATVEINGEKFTVTSSASVHPGDKPNDEIGLKLVVGRVLDKISNKLLKQADGLVKHQQDMKEYRKKQKARDKNNPVGLRVGDRFRFGGGGPYEVVGEPYQEESPKKWVVPITWVGRGGRPFPMRIRNQDLKETLENLTVLED